MCMLPVTTQSIHRSTPAGAIQGEWRVERCPRRAEGGANPALFRGARLGTHAPPAFATLAVPWHDDCLATRVAHSLHRLRCAALAGCVLILGFAAHALAQTTPPAPPAGNQTAAPQNLIRCESNAGERKSCPANT